MELTNEALGYVLREFAHEYIVALHNDSDETRVVTSGQRIAQLIIIPYIAANFVECDELTDTERGEGGFGSTGDSLIKG